MAVGRPVKLEIDFLNDAGYLNRLLQRVTGERTQNAQWREDAAAHLRALILLFTTAGSAPANGAADGR